MEKQPVSAQPLLSSGARGRKGATAVADAVESPRTADFDLWEDAPPEKDARCCGVSRRCGVALIAALSVAAVGGFFLSSRRTRPITEGLIGCGTKEQCLTIIDNYFLNAKRQKYAGNGAGLVQTYGPGSIGGGPCGDEHCKLVEPCPNFAQRNPGDGTPHCRFDVYDNALTAIYLAKRGKLQESRQVLDAFIGLLYPTGNVTPGLDYGAGYLLPSRRSLTLLAAGYTDKRADAGVYEGMGVADGAVDTGNNAWVGMAFAHYAAATGDACYSLVAHDMLAALVKSTQCTDEMQGFGSRLTPFPQNYRSTEHNTDMFALAHMLGAAGAAAEKQAGAFVRSMWELVSGDSKFSKYGNSSYAVGTANNYPCDRDVPEMPAAVDAQFWNLLAGVDPVPERKAASMAFAMQEQDPTLNKTTPAEPKGLWARDTDLIGNVTSGVGRGAVLHGVRFTSGGNGIQWENTASACMAMCRFRSLYGDETVAGDLRPKIQAATDSIKHLLAVYGVVPASVLGGNINAYQVNDFNAEYPGGSDTGIGWTYLRYPHAASTAWAGLLLLYQFDEDDAIDENANPFAPPANPVPNPQQSPPRGAPGWVAAQKYRQCLPITEVPEPATGGKGASASCGANLGCAHLVGECCPTTEGMLLACCSDDHAPPAPPPAPPYPPPTTKNIFGRDTAVGGPGGEDAPHGTEPGGKGGGGGKGEGYSGSGRGEHGALSSDRCEANRGCAVLGLTGWCCPTLEGTQLGCC